MLFSIRKSELQPHIPSRIFGCRCFGHHDLSFSLGLPCGEIELEAHELPRTIMTPAQIKAIRLKVASSTKEFKRLFGIPARTMESYEQGRRNLDGAMRALLRIIDREPKLL